MFSGLLPADTKITLTSRRGTSMPPIKRDRVLLSSQKDLLLKQSQKVSTDNSPSDTSRSKASNYHPNIEILDHKKEILEIRKNRT